MPAKVAPSDSFALDLENQIGELGQEAETYVVETYERLGYQMIGLPTTSVEERTAFIIDHIEART